MDDHELLRDYVNQHAQEAFRQLVERHLGMVYAAARRMVRDAHLAEEVAQNVFVLLSQKAASLKPPLVLAGWLYNSSRHLAMHAVRTEQRRRQREEKAAAMQISDSSPDLSQVLDQVEGAMARLEAEDRDTLVLRYFEDRSLRDVGAELGVSEDAARMRVNRAVEKIRSLLEADGIRITSVLLVSALAASTAAVVPSALAATITAAVTSAAAATTATYAIISTMNWINAKSITAVLAAAVLTGTGTYLVQQQRVAQLRTENAQLITQREQLAANNKQNDAPIAPAQTPDPERTRDANELLRLRNEVGQLRRQLAERAAQTGGTANTRAPAPSRASVAGTYLPKERLADAGFATPEAGLQTVAWAIMNGTVTQISNCLSAELVADTNAFQVFERNSNQMGALLQGIQMLAKKTIDENHVEMKTRYDLAVGANPTDVTPLLAVIPMIRTENGWKLGRTRDYSESWDQTGNVEPLAP